MRILQVNFSDAHGGASRACYRLFRALRGAGHDARLMVLDKHTDDPDVVGRRGLADRVRRHLAAALEVRVLARQHTSDMTFRSLGLAGAGLGREIARSDADVLNLHWINDGALTIGEIGALAKPVVWTLHDTWAFCGTEHYPVLGAERWAAGYDASNRPPGHTGLDIDAWAWRRKRRLWRRPMTIVTPSTWLARCASRSPLMQGWDVHAVPNPLDTQLYRPLDQGFCREALRLPADRPVIAMGALGATRDPRKGFELLMTALRHVAQHWPGGAKPVCVVFGQSRPADAPDMGLECVWAGAMKDDLTLVMTYNAADVVVVPSLQENLAQSATESQSCGVPVVGFDATGMPDAVEHGVTGLLATPYDAAELGRCIVEVLRDRALRARLSAAARERAVRLWSPAVVVPQYMRVFEEAARQPASGRIGSVNQRPA